MRFVTPHEIREALAHAKLISDVDVVWDELILLQSELGTRARTLAIAAEVLGKPLGPSSRPGSSWSG